MVVIANIMATFIVLVLVLVVAIGLLLFVIVCYLHKSRKRMFSNAFRVCDN